MISTRSFRLLSFISFFTGMTFFMLSTFGRVDVAGLTIFSLALLMAPPLLFVFGQTKGVREIHSLITLLIPLTLMNYLHSLRIGFPVGFQDVHSHIDEARALLSAQGFIDFDKAQTVSFSFVGLYVITWFVSIVTNFSVVTIALLVAPSISVLVALLVYLVARRIFDARIASLALIFYAWDNNTILFGHEYRTQTLGTLFTLGALLVYLCGRGRGGLKPGPAAIGILFLFALAASSFVSYLFALVFFSVLAALPIFRKSWYSTIDVGQYVILVAFFALYVLYISTTTYGGPSAVVASIIALVREAFSPPSLPILSVGQEIYGPIVRLFTYGFWSLFGILFIVILRWRLLERDKPSLPIVSGLSVTFAAGVSFSTFSILNPGRAYAIGSILIGLVVSLGLLSVLKRIDGRSRRKVIAGCCAFVILFVGVSTAKFPSYIVGNADPLRGSEVIDAVAYWRLSTRDESVAAFLLIHSNGESVHLDMLIKPYMLLALYREGLLPAPSTHDSNGRLLWSNIKPGDLILLRNHYGEREYAFRELLPPESSYSSFSLIYTDGDFNLYYVGP